MNECSRVRRLRGRSIPNTRWLDTSNRGDLGSDCYHWGIPFHPDLPSVRVKTMKLILANPRGFCAGVNMAIAVVDELLELFPDETICVYHEIVHNRHVVDRFRSQGIIFVESIEETPENAVVVFSAHGVSPKIRAQAAKRKLVSIDATCPLVTKVHAEAIRYAKRGWQILLIGHADHQEVIGTRGEAPEAIQIVETLEDIPNLRIDDPEKLIYLTQTTLSTDDAGLIISALKKAIPSIKAPPSEDICYATTNRRPRSERSLLTVIWRW